MTHESTLILLGILTVLSPFLGLPYSWLMWVVPVLGLVTIAIGITLRARRQHAREEQVPVAAHTDEVSSAL